MQQQNWNILIAQLAVNGLMIKDQIVYDYKLKQKCTLQRKIGIFKAQFQSIKSLFEQTWCSLNTLLQSVNNPGPFNHNKIDRNRKLLFLHSLDRLSLMATDLGLSKSSIMGLLKKDIYDVSQQIILTLPDIHIALDVLLRKMNKFRYLAKLLRFYSFGQNKINSIKMAAGVQGPYSNLDLPMSQRSYNWSDIQQQFSSSTSDKQKQYRYRKGYQAYNYPGFGQGSKWVQQKNQPFLWSQRATEDPYPSRSVLSN